MARTLNLGVLAHVDAGKTSLTERLLYAAGVIEAPGRVDHGNTRTDTLDLERQRGITIRSAVASFTINEVVVNLIDTPGHPDFIAEVERVLNVLDGVVLVVSAVEGVQAQTRVLSRTLRRLGIPTLFLVNKVDRQGADPVRVTREIADKLTPAVLAMGTVRDPGTRAACTIPYQQDDPAHLGELLELVSNHDEGILASYVRDGAVAYPRLRRALRRQSRRGLIHPVFFGSAITGAGSTELIDGITDLLPSTVPATDDQVAGSVFKIERDSSGEKVAYVRMARGVLRARQRVAVLPPTPHATRSTTSPEPTEPTRLAETAGSPDIENGDPIGKDRENTTTERKREKATRIELFADGETVPSQELPAGRIGRIRGLSTVRIGDGIGSAIAAAVQPSFAPPTLETVVVPAHPTDRGPLRTALGQLAEQDPLIGVRQDDARDELSVSLYGEVQKEVIQATLANDYGIRAFFRETSTICVERPSGIGAAVEYLEASLGAATHQSLTPTIALQPHPFLATVGLRVEPAAPGAGVGFRLEVEPGSMPLAFFRAVQEGAHRALRQGLTGWQVIDCVIVLTHTGYSPRQGRRGVQFDQRISSTANDFRNLTPLVLMAALRQAGTQVYEPMQRIRLEIPPDTVPVVAAGLPRLGGVLTEETTVGSSIVLYAEIPAGQVHALRLRLSPWTRGEGALESEFDHYHPVRGVPPSRPRTQPDPLDRRQYLLQVGRRTQLV